jgi:hypothetical protein
LYTIETCRPACCRLDILLAELCILGIEVFFHHVNTDGGEIKLVR